MGSAPNSILNEIVDNVYVLNLDKDLFKYKILARKLEALKIKHERFVGKDGSSSKFFSEWHGTGFGTAHRSSGAAGCLFSYIAILEDAIEKQYKKILLLQDDIYFHKGFDKLLEMHSSAIISSDGYYLGASEWSDAWRNVRDITYRPTLKTNGLFGLILGDRTFEDSLKLMRCCFLAADQSVSTVLNNGFKETSYVAYPNLIIADTGKSGTWSKGSPSHNRPLKEHGERVGWDITQHDLSEKYYSLHADWYSGPQYNEPPQGRREPSSLEGIK